MGKHVVCLYEHSGLSAKDWFVNGYNVFNYDIQNVVPRHLRNERGGSEAFLHWDAKDAEATQKLLARHIGKTALVLAFPPCDDLAVLGALWFDVKRKHDPMFQEKAYGLVKKAVRIAQRLGAPYCVENPVSVLSSMWRAPDYIVHPYEFGGYLPEDDVHPLYPDYIVPRDAYPKRTCYWVSKGFVFPRKKPVFVSEGVSKQYAALGGKRKMTKLIRSASPRGFARAVFEHNSRSIGT